MAKQPNLGQITSPVFSVNQLNQAYAKIDAAFENTLSLDGSTPNAMQADLDLNSNDIINAGVVYGQSIDVAEAVIGGKLFTGTITWRSDWETGISYQNLDVVRYNGDLYICLEEHTSGTFSSDLSTDKWELFVENTVGPQGDPGADGNDGATGPAGQGVPVGGTTGQVLAKVDGTDYNTEWVDQSGGAGVTDGDKGDITVSGSGATWTIDNDTVTIAKLANFTTDVLLGRDTAGTGDPELIGVGGGVEFNGAGSIRTTAFTGDVTKTAGGTVLTIANDVVTNAKLANVATSTIKGRTTAGTGDPEDLTATQVRTLINVADGATANSSDATLLARANHTGTQLASTISDFATAVAATASVTANTAKVSNATHTGDVTGSTALTIANDVVTNAKLANVATATIKGRTTAGTGDPEDLTGTQATALLDTFTSGAKGLAPASGGGTSNFLRADGTWAAPGGGGGGSGDVVGPASATDNALARFDGTTGKLIQNSGATLDDNGVLTIPSAPIPAAPASASLSLFARTLANRPMLAQIGPAGIDTILQPHIGGNRIYWVSPTSGTGAPNTIGGTTTVLGTASLQQTFGSTNRWLSTTRKRYQTTTTAGNTASTRQAYTNWMRGSAAGFGGFFFRVQVGSSINLNGSQMFVGLCGATGAMANDPSTDFPLNMCGMGWEAADSSAGNWQFFRNDGTGSPVKVDLGATEAARSTNVGYELNMFMAPGGSELFVHIINLNTGNVVIDTSYTTDIPAADTGMAFKCDVRNGSVAAAVNIEWAKIYLEADY